MDAKNLRYQRPIAKELNFHTINEELWDMQCVCQDVQWMTEDDERMESIFDGDSEQAWEFRIAFSDLLADMGRMRNDINAVELWNYDDEPGDEPSWTDEPSENVPTIFDLFFPAIDGDDSYLGFDTYEGDYFGLDYYLGDFAKRAARKKVLRLTKEQILDAAGQCMRIARQYLALKYRFQCLKSAIDVLSQENITLLRVVKAIEEAYDKAEEASHGFKFDFGPDCSAFDQMLKELQDRFWVE